MQSGYHYKYPQKITHTIFVPYPVENTAHVKRQRQLRSYKSNEGSKHDFFDNFKSFKSNLKRLQKLLKSGVEI